MKSSELARLADVSVRTLRHYHQIGLLPEPERSANGYRMYTAADLVRVLRARRLGDLGVPLARIDPDLDVDQELALLDDQYARQIQELEQRRQVIERLRGHGMHADVPAFVHAYLAALGERPDVSPRSLEVEGDAAVVLELFLEPDTLAGIGALDGRQVTQLAAVSAALLALADDAADQHIDAVAEALATAIRGLPPILTTRRLTQEASDALQDHVSMHLDAVQLDAVRRAVRLLDA